MSSNPTIDDHDQLTDIGSLRHVEIDKIILEGIVPDVTLGPTQPDPNADPNDPNPPEVPVLTSPRNIAVPLLPGDNAFLGTNTFETVNVNGDLNVYGTRNEINVSNLDIENTVITLGHGTGGELPASDRGIIFTSPGDNPSLFWDDTEQEFRLALVDANPSVTEFPEPSAFANLHAGDITANAVIANSLSAPSANITAINADSLVISNSVNFASANVDLGVPDIQQANIGVIKTLDGSVDYLERYVKPGAGILVDSDQEDPGSLILSIDRKKEVLVPAVFLPANNTLPSNIISNTPNLTAERLDVFVNGVLVSMGSNYDYVIEGGGIKFYFALESDDVVTIITY